MVLACNREVGHFSVKQRITHGRLFRIYVGLGKQHLMGAQKSMKKKIQSFPSFLCSGTDSAHRPDVDWGPMTYFC